METRADSPRDRAPNAAAERLPLSTKLSFGLGAAAYGIKDNGFSFFLLLYYNQVLGLPQKWVGLAIMTALVADALSDPIVGHASDHLHSRWGRRHPFMYASALPIAATYFLLWNPPGGLSERGLFFYLVSMAILVRTAITFYEIPSTALVAELTQDYDERTSLVSYRFFCGWWGGLTMSVLAYVVFLQPDADHPVGVLNPRGYGGYGLFAAALMTMAILASALGTHRHIPRLKQPPAKKPFSAARTIRELRETLSNRSFLALFVMGMLTAMGVGLSSSLNIYFMTFFWELGSNEISVIVLGTFLSAAIALAAAPAISTRLGKKRAAIVTALLAVLLAPLPIVLRLAGSFPENDSPALLPTLFLFAVTDVTLVIVASILVSSMVADVVEDSEVVTGRRSEGLFFAARSFIAKSVSGVGVFLSTVLLGFVGFPENAKPGEIDPTVVTRLASFYVPCVLLLYLAAVASLLGYRIDRDRHGANLRRLAKERARRDSNPQPSDPKSDALVR